MADLKSKFMEQNSRRKNVVDRRRPNSPGSKFRSGIDRRADPKLTMRDLRVAGTESGGSATGAGRGTIVSAPVQRGGRLATIAKTAAKTNTGRVAGSLAQAAAKKVVSQGTIGAAIKTGAKFLATKAAVPLAVADTAYNVGKAGVGLYLLHKEKNKKPVMARGPRDK